MKYKDFTNQRIKLKEAVPLEKPLSIFIEPTNSCVFRCVSCPLSLQDYKKFRKYSRLDFKSFEVIIYKIKQDFYKIKRLNFYMIGEPLLNKDIFKFTTLAKEIEVAEKIVVSTNGALITKDIFNDILTSGIDYLTISIYGKDELSFKKITQSGYSYYNILKNIKELKNYKEKISSSTIIACSVFDCEESKSVIPILEDICDEVFIKPVIDWTEEYGKFTQSLGISYEYSQFKRKRTCSAPFYQMVIHSDLNVSPCCNDWAQKLVMGNIREENPKEIWLGNRWRLFRETIIKNGFRSIKACKYCYTPFFESEEDNLDELTFDEYIKRSKELYEK